MNQGVWQAHCHMRALLLLWHALQFMIHGLLPLLYSLLNLASVGIWQRGQARMNEIGRVGVGAAWPGLGNDGTREELAWEELEGAGLGWRRP